MCEVGSVDGRERMAVSVGPQGCLPVRPLTVRLLLIDLDKSLRRRDRLLRVRAIDFLGDEARVC